MTDPILSIKQVCRELGVGRTTLWKMYTHQGLIEPPVRISAGRVGYRRSTIEAYKRRGAA